MIVRFESYVYEDLTIENVTSCFQMENGDYRVCAMDDAGTIKVHVVCGYDYKFKEVKI